MTNSSIPPPISFTPSQQWDGNDGKWSSFYIRVGTPDQNFRVFPGGSTGNIIVPLVQGCAEPNDPKDCGTSRGVQYSQGNADAQGFRTNASSSWQNFGLYTLGIRPDINFTGNGLFGLDTVGLMIPNSGGISVEKRVVAGIATKNIYVGIFGLDVRPSNFSGYEAPIPSFMKTLKDQNKIPSLSYGYTAGAYYKEPKVMGSLVLGGIDETRFKPSNQTFPFGAPNNRRTSLKVFSIIVDKPLNNNTMTSLIGGEQHYTYLDSTVPHLWLPGPVCDNFKEAFQLNYDNKTGLYLVNDTTHTQLLQNNPSVTFGLGTSTDATNWVNIVLPYRAFDLMATHPYYPNATRYFPIRRAVNETQYTLGRTLLQEAYLAVDYERKNFSIHQARFPEANENERIVTIVSPETVSNSTQPNSPSGGGRLSRGAVAGISVGVVGFTAICMLVAIWTIRRLRKKTVGMVEDNDKCNGPELEGQGNEKGEIHGAEVLEMSAPPGYEVEGTPKAELECTSPQELPAEVPRWDRRDSK